MYFFFFKQKTAYEMLRSLVGSEMCIRDRLWAGVVALVGYLAFQCALDPSSAVLPDRLEPILGVSQCNYEMLRAWSRWAHEKSVRYTLGAGTLLGAMRTSPPGLLQWEHDVDVYMPARDAAQAVELLRAECGADPSNPWCQDTLHFRGLVDENNMPCCGFGFKLYHRGSEACQLDVLVLAQSSAPFIHGETAWWPPQIVAQLIHAMASLVWQQTFWVIPEDVDHKLLMHNSSRWCQQSEWSWCGGPAVSYFQGEYFLEHELFPVRFVDFYNLKLPIPHDPWASLNRTYGTRCGYIARLSEHGSIEFDMRLPENAHLREPANVSLLP
eukprot:TRINITY_DN22870_c0_g1_i1.p1 TRINITY_DN22870_c0_g1~~TRINITY_DN22870_c0_g1_i1.p1  ORF type:complete len:326 (+),score=49.87 TRINITY_DN22870_c0_g1_i1:79-1056(+)